MPISVAEDVAATGVSLLAILVPLAAGTLLIVALALLFWLWWNRSNKQAANS
jgi:Flp pilus assembly protein TadB